MEITEVRIKLMEDSDDRLQAFCSITFDDCFVVRDLKIIEGANGPFVAMPSRKLTAHCPKCGVKNPLRVSYCNQCGYRLKDDRTVRDQEGRAKLYADIAHPINSECREMIQQRVIAEYQSELDRSQQPGYQSLYDEDYEDAPPAGVEDRESAGAGESAARPQVQPPEPEPRPPHALPSREPAARPPANSQSPNREQANRPSEGRNDDNFGAGIF